VAKAGLPGLGLHSLRSSNATALVAEGVDVKIAQVRLGHTDPRVTLGIYAKATTEGDRRPVGRAFPPAG
jgi:integrase